MTIRNPVAAPMDAYQPIADYGLIGDCHTAALVSIGGSVDWLCAPRFDSPSVFARILDAKRGGYFGVHPVSDFSSQHEYVGYSGVLRTTFRTASGSVALTDFMPLRLGAGPLPWGKPRPMHRLVRLIEGIEGEVDLAIEIEPRPNYGRDAPHLEATPDGLTIRGNDGFRHRLYSHVRFSIEDARAVSTTSLRAGERIALVLELAANEPEHGNALSTVSAQLDETLEFWNAWCERCQYRGPYEEIMMRSALTLKMLTYARTGGMIAAPTTSLPEEIGGERNWDYRYTWIRDASFAAHALFHAGHKEDGIAFMEWVCQAALRCRPGEAQIMYRVDGERDLPEHVLGHLEGHRRSRPVRIGNAASVQFQLDVYGELLDCFYTYWRVGGLRPEALDHFWPVFSYQVDFVADHWREPDCGIWEMRAEPRHFVYSKVMAWVALDRGIRLAEELGLPANLEKWRAERSAIRSEVLERGYDPVLRSFTQSYGAPVLDAANLLLTITCFIATRDPRMQSTIEAIRTHLVVDDVVYRYRGVDDGLPGNDGAFGACAFWLVENLAACGRVEEARDLFERQIARATPLGLFAEEIDPRTHAHLGNFPQAFTHLALINAGLSLTRAGP